ncbi:hypothetical protein [Actinotalea sp. K2]|nr:hypothetical protein [Actinotalea sp. K2]
MSRIAKTFAASALALGLAFAGAAVAIPAEADLINAGPAGCCRN